MKTPDFVADIKVGSKTIEDIKKWLACWSVTYTDACSGECETCEYDVGEKESVGMGGKTLAYIQQLESRLAQVERERDAAVADCSRFPCATCSDKANGDLCHNCNVRKDTTRTNHEWRGVCKENTKEEGK